MIPVDHDDCASVALENFLPKPTTLTPGQIEASRHILGDAKSDLRVGVWECTPGRFTVSRTTTEVSKILSGKVTLHETGGPSVSYGAGSFVVVPTGWTGEWEVLETVRKIFVVYPS